MSVESIAETFGRERGKHHVEFGFLIATQKQM